MASYSLGDTESKSVSNEKLRSRTIQSTFRKNKILKQSARVREWRGLTVILVFCRVL